MPTNIVAGGDRAGIFSAVQYRRFRPLWASLVPERDLLNAVSLLQANQNGVARLLGPLLAAPLFNVGGGAAPSSRTLRTATDRGGCGSWLGSILACGGCELGKALTYHAMFLNVTANHPASMAGEG